MKPSRILAVVGIVTVVLVLIASVRFIRWRYDHVSLSPGQRLLVRTDRFSGFTQTYTGDGWRPTKTRPKRDVPVAVLRDLKAIAEPQDSRHLRILISNNTEWWLREVKVEIAGLGVVADTYSSNSADDDSEFETLDRAINTIKAERCWRGAQMQSGDVKSHNGQVFTSYCLIPPHSVRLVVVSLGICEFQTIKAPISAGMANKPRKLNWQWKLVGAQGYLR